MKRGFLLFLLLLLTAFAAHAQQGVTFPVKCVGVDDTALFTAIVTNTGSQDATIIIPWKSDPTTRCKVSTLSLPTRITLDNTNGSGIGVIADQTLTVAGPRINPPGKTMFFGPGTTVTTGPTYLSSANTLETLTGILPVASGGTGRSAGTGSDLPVFNQEPSLDGPSFTSKATFPNGSQIWMENLAGTATTKIQPSATTTNWTLTLPTSGGTAGEMLVANGGGTTGFSREVTSPQFNTVLGVGFQIYTGTPGELISISTPASAFSGYKMALPPTTGTTGQVVCSIGSTVNTLQLGLCPITTASLGASFSIDPTLAPNSNTIIPSQAAIKSYVDSVAVGLQFKTPVRFASTTAGTLASSFENGDPMDTGTLITGNRILIKDQVTQTENGIYTVNASGAPTRATDADADAEVPHATVLVQEGSVNLNSTWTNNNTSVTLGATNITFVLFSSSVTFTAGDGLDVNANQFSIEPLGVTPAMLLGSIPASKLIGTDIVTVGTVTAGTWQGSTVAGLYGGTGVANSGKTITLGGNLATSGAFPVTFTVGASTNVALPASGTLIAESTATTLTRLGLGVAAHGTDALALSASTPQMRITATNTSGTTGTIGATGGFVSLGNNVSVIDGSISSATKASSQVTLFAGALDSYVLLATGSANNVQGTERMRIIKDGKVGIGTSTPTQLLDVNGIIRTATGIRFGDGTTQTTAASGGTTATVTVVNCKTQHSAVGDGVTDDTVALNACFAAAAGGVAYLSKGTYIVGALSAIAANTQFIGDGKGVTIIKRKAGLLSGTDLFKFTGAMNRIAHMTIDGNGPNISFISDPEIEIYNSGTPTAASDAVVEDVEIINSGYESILIRGPRAKIDRLVCRGSGQPSGDINNAAFCIEVFTDGDDATITNSVFKDFRLNAIITGGTSSRTTISDSLFEGNHRSTSPFGGGQVDLAGTGVGHKFIGNTCTVGGGTASNLTSCLEMTVPTIVQGNYMNGGGFHLYGIAIQGAAEGYLISGNRVLGYSIGFFASDDVSAIDYLNVKGNDFRGNTSTFFMNSAGTHNTVNSLVAEIAKGPDVTSSSTITPTGLTFTINGTTPINTISTANINPGMEINMITSSAVPFTEAGNIDITGASSLTTSAGSLVKGVWDGTKWRVSSTTAGGGGGSVTSIFGRTGVVSSLTGDYTWAQIDKSTSSFADLQIRSAADINSGFLSPDRLASGTALQVLRRNAANSALEFTDSVNSERTIGEFASLPVAVTSIGATATTLVINAVTTVGTSTTIPSTLAIRFTGAGQLSINSGVVVTFTDGGKLSAPSTKQIFAGAGTVQFTGRYPDKFYPEWWGAVADGATDLLAPFNAMQASMKAVDSESYQVGGTVSFNAGIYRHSDTIKINKAMLVGGQGPQATYLKAAANRTSIRIDGSLTEDGGIVSPSRRGFLTKLQDFGVIQNAPTTTHQISVTGRTLTWISNVSAEATQFTVDGDGLTTLVGEGYSVTFGGVQWLVKRRVSNTSLELFPYRLALRPVSGQPAQFDVVYGTLPSSYVGATVAVRGVSFTISAIGAAAPSGLQRITFSGSHSIAVNTDGEITSIPATGTVNAIVNSFAGIDARIEVFLQNLLVLAPAGSGIQLDSEHSPSTSPAGQPNQNNSVLDKVWVQLAKGVGVLARGVNANNISYRQSKLERNAAGFYEGSFLGGHIYDAHSQGNTHGDFISCSVGSNKPSGTIIHGFYSESDQPSMALCRNAVFKGGTAGAGFATSYTSGELTLDGTVYHESGSANFDRAWFNALDADGTTRFQAELNNQRGNFSTDWFMSFRKGSASNDVWYWTTNAGTDAGTISLAYGNPTITDPYKTAFALAGTGSAFPTGSIVFPRGFYGGFDSGSRRRFEFVTAIPSSGTVSLGDIFWNKNATPGAPVGWVVTLGGTVGSGATFARIGAELSGAGSPEGVVTAPIGTFYINTSGGAGATFWVKESGSGNTGWSAK